MSDKENIDANLEDDVEDDVAVAESGSESDSDLDEKYLFLDAKSTPKSRCGLLKYNGEDWINGIPTRAELIKECHCATAEAAVAPLARRDAIKFMPVDVDDINEFDRNVQVYALRLFGALPDGSKAEVTVTGIRPFFDVQVPDGQLPNVVETLLRGLVCGDKAMADFERVKAMPDRGYRDQPVTFIRVICDNLQNRRAALDQVLMAANDPTSKLYKLQTKSDDRSSYYRKAARELGLPLSDWAQLTDYEYVEGPTTRSPLCQHIFRVAATGYRPLCDQFAPAAERAAAATARAADPLLVRDRTLVLAWDIETHSGRGLGDVPLAEHAQDHVFMICLTAHWKDEATPLRRICLVDVPTAPDSRWLTIACGNEKNLLKAFGLCFHALAPDIMAGFNDSGYDWPFVVGKAAQLGLLGQLVHTMTAAPKKTAADDGMARRWNYQEEKKIKISAEETFLSSYLRVPGCVPIDVRVSFKKLFPKSETPAAGSLKFYLQVSGLPGKADMPIGRMWKTYEAALALRAEAALALRSEAALALRAEAALALRATPGKKLADKPAADQEFKTPTALGMRAVAHYCVVDAERCQALLVRRAVISDYREVSTLAYVAMSDSHYYAGGMKVCNLLGAYAWRRNVLMTMRAGERTTEGKYPGAYVFPPAKGVVPDPGRFAVFEQMLLEGVLPAAAGEPLASDRPVTGLDFSSLYPSLIMAYNLSPDRYLATAAEAAAWQARGAEIHPVEFPYGGSVVRGWFVRHGNITKEIGLYPSVLIDLFAKRAEIKVTLGVHGATREQIGVAMARASADRISVAEALGRTIEDAQKELDEASLRLAELDKGAPPSRGATVEEDRSDAQRRKKQAQSSITELRRIAALADAADATSAVAREKARADFDYVCANAKQGALKVYMNTFYGEAGNALSPLFLLPLAGGVTSAGKDNIQAVAEFIQARGFGLKYGDTDSLYLTCPSKHFVECDTEFAAALRQTGGQARHAAKEEWMGAQVRVTIRIMNFARDIVNKFLRDRSGGGYLKMAYEEVLYPVVFTGKKKYFGTPHVSEVNFRPKELFVRGIDVVKQGQPGLAREIGFRIMWACMALDNQRVVYRIVTDTLQDAILNSAQWNFSHFIKTDAYKPLKNNIPVQRFVARMRATYAALQAAGSPQAALYVPPEAGERFQYVIARNASAFDLHGRKAAPSKGERMAFARVAKEPLSGIEVDVAFYMIQYVAGLCARFVNSEPEFAAAGAPALEAGDEARADELSQKAAKKALEEFIRGLGGLDATTMRRRGTAYRRAYTVAATVARTELEKSLGPAVATTLQGDWLNYETLLGENISEQVDSLWTAAGALAKTIAADPVRSRMLAKKFGIGADGADLDNPETSLHLFELTNTKRSDRAQRPVPQAARAAASALDRYEASVRQALAALAPAVSDIAIRYETNLEQIVQTHRLKEHEIHPELGEIAAGAPPVPIILGESDREQLLKLRTLWFRAVGIQVMRARTTAFTEYLSRLRMRRTGGVAPSRLARATAIEEASQAFQPRGNIVI